MKFVGACEYDGSSFSGFQSQKNAQSVQGTLEKAISSVGRLTNTINYSGRTDAGVHSLGQVFDFESVDFVGVVNADHMLYFPDFRSGERTFQLITQVAGRTGRRDRVGKVMLQTHRSNHPIINAIMQHDYYQMYETELAERNKFSYPPFTRLILLQIKSFEAFDAEKAANFLGKTLKPIFGERILGPAKPHVSKVKRWHIREILIKINRTTDDLLAIKKAIKKEVDQFHQSSDFKKVRVTINVDPS